MDTALQNNNLGIKKNTWGGAGRGQGAKIKPHTLKTAAMRKELVDTVHREFGSILIGQTELAKGLWKEMKVMGKYRRVFQKDPDIRAGEYLINQVLGKPRETVDLGGQSDNPINVNILAAIGKVYGDN